MSSGVSRRTTVRESTTVRRKSSRLARDSELKQTIDSNRLDDRQHSNLNALMEEDYFESGSYRQDRIGLPWRSPNLSRRGIHSDYTGYSSMKTRRTTISQYDVRDDYNDRYSSSCSNQIELSTTPVTTHSLQSAYRQGGGDGVAYRHSDSSKETTEKVTTNHIMDKQWNLDTNNSAQASSESSKSSLASAISRVTLWRTSGGEIVQQNSSSSEGRRNRQGHKQVSSIYGLDENGNARVTRSRTKRLESNHISASDESASDSATSRRLSCLELSKLYFLHSFCVFTYLYDRLRITGSLAVSTLGKMKSAAVSQVTEIKQYYGVPWALLPFFLLIYYPLYILSRPVKLIRRWWYGGSEDAMVESRESGGSRKRSICLPCFFLILAAVIVLGLLLCRFGYLKPLDAEKARSVAGFVKDKGQHLKDDFQSGSLYILDEIRCVTSHYSGRIIDFGKIIIEKISNFFIHCWSNILSVKDYLLGSIRTIFWPNILSVKNYLLVSIRREQDEEQKPIPTWTPDIPSKAAPGKDPRVDQILITLREHDKLIRQQRDLLNGQQKVVSELTESSSKANRATDELKSTMGKFESDLHAIQKRTVAIDATLLQLQQMKKSKSESVDHSTVTKLINEKQKSTDGEITALRDLLEKLKKLVEEQNHATQSKLKQNEESFAKLTTQMHSIDVNVKQKSTSSHPNVERLAKEVTSGHERLVVLQTQYESLSKLIVALQNDQGKTVAQQDQLKKDLTAMSKKGQGGGTTILSSGSCKSRASNVQQLIDQALNIFAADRIAKPDFALESAGGSIIGTRCTTTYTDRPAVFSIFGIPLFRLSRSPRSVIQPAVQPGECWAFRGTKGQVVVRLSSDIEITAVTLEHIPKSLSPTGRIESAPREFEVRGLESESDFEGWLLGKFEFLEDGPPLQTFSVEPPVENEAGIDAKKKKKRTPPSTFRYVELLILNNHGHPDYTCVYRLRVHGNFVNTNDGKRST